MQRQSSDMRLRAQERPNSRTGGWGGWGQKGAANIAGRLEAERDSEHGLERVEELAHGVHLSGACRAPDEKDRAVLQHDASAATA